MRTITLISSIIGLLLLLTHPATTSPVADLTPPTIDADKPTPWGSGQYHFVLFIKESCNGKSNDITTTAQFFFFDDKKQPINSVKGPGIGKPAWVYGQDVGEIRGSNGFYFRWRYYENGNEGNNNDRSQKMTYEFPPERPTDEEDHRSCNVKPWSEYDGKNKAWWNECGHGKGISSFRTKNYDCKFACSLK